MKIADFSEEASAAIYRIMRAKDDYVMATGNSIVLKMYIPFELYEAICPQGEGPFILYGIPVQKTRGNNIFFEGTYGDGL